MPVRRHPDQFSRPGRLFFDLIKEYSEGSLTDNHQFYRARVEGVDSVGGQFAQNPANPPRSIRARIYTSGLDASIPEEALAIFYPMFPNVTAQQGEHVLVMFEDEQKTSGYWLNVVPSFSVDPNYSNPDFRTTQRTDSSYVFEQDPQVQSTIDLDLEYGGGTLSTTGRQEMVDLAESQVNNPWENKKVLVIGDSQVAGPWGLKLRDLLRNQNSALSVVLEGRTGWGVYSWLQNRLRSDSEIKTSLRDLIQQNSPDILIISLGGNDGSSGFARRGNYQDKIRELLEQAQAVQKIIWSGPPTSVGPAADRQAGREVAARKIQEVVGNKFLNVFGVTNTTNGRRPDGVHFLPSSTALTPWAELVVRKGREIF